MRNTKRLQRNMPTNEFHEWVKKIAAMAGQWGDVRPLELIA